MMSRPKTKIQEPKQLEILKNNFNLIPHDIEDPYQMLALRILSFAMEDYTSLVARGKPMRLGSGEISPTISGLRKFFTSEWAEILTSNRYTRTQMAEALDRIDIKYSKGV